ncbi:MAG: hypothetical protein F6J97_16430 [Leptolyngbya sp. SIO4C1]|nr:hypothetical protein [Leptolyngbya sp. SIO4C1]
MTYTNVDKQQAAESLNQIKAEGGVRLKKVAQILRAAFAESATELKEGATNVSPAAKELRDVAAVYIRETAEEAKDVWAHRNQREGGFFGWLRGEFQAILRAFRASVAKQETATRDEVLTPVKLNAAEAENDPITTDVA